MIKLAKIWLSIWVKNQFIWVKNSEQIIGWRPASCFALFRLFRWHRKILDFLYDGWPIPGLQIMGLFFGNTI